MLHHKRTASFYSLATGQLHGVRLQRFGAGRALKTQAAAVPACVLARSQCTVQELQALTQQIQQLRDRLTAQPSTASL